MSRILVVDDEPDERFLLRRMFERAGHEVLDAADGAAALAIVRESAPDLIVTDMMMPVMDGPELIRQAFRSWLRPGTQVSRARLTWSSPNHCRCRTSPPP
jgi:CheY-like chemotaxis protein